jgi:NAD(P)-dependent dehydrogenase (short-subunit alcohol dehydrogenase family)
VRRTLSGRTAIVTGASHGIGAAASCALGRAGASVVLAAADGPALEAVARAISAAGGHAVAVATDLTNPVSVRRLVEQTLGAFGRLDAAVDTDGVALAMKYLLPSMRRGGRIVDLALDFADSGVRINAVAVHAIATEVAAAILGARGTGHTPASCGR